MKFLKGLAIFILGIVLFMSTSALLFLIPFKNTFDKDAIKETITSLDISKLVEENQEIKDAIDEAFEPIIKETEKYGIDEEFVIDLMNSKEIKGFFGGIAGNIVDYVITGENQKLVSNEEVETLITQAIDDINQSGYYEIKPELKEEILTVAKEKVEEYQDFIPDTNIIGDNLPEEDQETIKLIRFVLGNELTLYLTIALIVSILGIVLLNYKEGKFIKTISINVLISSIFAIIATIIIKIFSKDIFAEIPLILDMLKPFTKSSFTLSITLTVLMIITLIVYSIVKHQNKSLDTSSKVEAES